MAIGRLKIRNESGTRRRADGSGAVHILIFVIPCAEFIQLKVIGTLFGSELLFLVVFAYLVFRWKFQIPSPEGKKVLIFCSLWLASQCVTDVIRHSAFEDYARGWSNVGMTFVNLAVLCTLLYGRPRRLAIYGWGLVAGGFLRYFISPTEAAGGDPWKFGLALPSTLAVFLLASRNECRGYWPIALSLMIGLANVVLGSRSMGGICISAALYLFVSRILGRKKSISAQVQGRTLAILAASIVVALGGVLLAYGAAASRGMLGEEARVKYEHQSAGQYGVLLGGRTEMLGYLPAIFDSPILGHGSWAKDPSYLLAEREALALMGYIGPEGVITDDLEEGYIPTHSYLFGAWVDAGIFGGIFWGFVLLIVLRALFKSYPAPTVLLPLMSFVGFELIWDILFSPYGAETRIIVPFYLLVVMTCLGMTGPDRHGTTTDIAKGKRRHADKTGIAIAIRGGAREPLKNSLILMACE